jgi:hypothetical protein
MKILVVCGSVDKVLYSRLLKKSKESISHKGFKFLYFPVVG